VNTRWKAAAAAAAPSCTTGRGCDFDTSGYGQAGDPDFFRPNCSSTSDCVSRFGQQFVCDGTDKVCTCDENFATCHNAKDCEDFSHTNNNDRNICLATVDPAILPYCTDASWAKAIEDTRKGGRLGDDGHPIPIPP
jgi:hypothetical protein